MSQGHFFKTLKEAKKTIKVLIVDDTPRLPMIIAGVAKLALKELFGEEPPLTFCYATNGIDALAEYQKNTDIRVVISDCEMGTPEYCGPAFFTNLRRELSFNPKKCLLIGCTSERVYKDSFIDAGAQHVLFKPLKQSEFTQIFRTIDWEEEKSGKISPELAEFLRTESPQLPRSPQLSRRVAALSL
jgi:response regulator RpfG family c-di-GMP phosphodiesterase